MWSGFEPESVSDARLLALMRPDYSGVDMPNRMVAKVGVLAATGDITAGEFKTTPEYVLGNA